MVSSGSSSRVLRVLMIEEDRDLLHSATTFLRGEGYLVDMAEDGDYGFFRGVAWDYDAIVLDVTLQTSCGVAVVEKLWTHKRSSPLLLLADAHSGNSVRAPESVSIATLAKPFTLSQLASQVGALVRHKPLMEEKGVHSDSLSLDAQSRSVLQNGTVVHLTNKEYRLFELLALRHGEVVTRAEIYDRLFGEFDSSLPNLLDAYVSKIRRKLGATLITTRRGVGYALGCQVAGVEQNRTFAAIRSTENAENRPVCSTASVARTD